MGENASKLQWLDKRARLWKIKMIILANVKWDKVIRRDDRLASPRIFLGVFHGLAFYPSLFITFTRSSPVAEAGLVIQERLDKATRFDGVKTLKFIEDARAIIVSELTARIPKDEPIPR